MHRSASLVPGAHPADRFRRSGRFGKSIALLLLVAASPGKAQLIPETALAFSQDSPSPKTDLNSIAELNDRVGVALAAGDFNGDGNLELVIGAPREDSASLTDSGWAHVVYGTPAGLSAVIDQIWDQDGAVAGGLEAGDLSGESVTAGDFNGDGYDDLAFGSPGEDIGTESNAGAINVIYGSAAGLTTTGNQQWHQNTTGIAGAAEPNDNLGASLAAGDFNRDGFDDVAFGGPRESIGTVSGAGVVQILYGSASGLTTAGSQSIDRGDSGMGGVNVDDYFGAALAVGDFNGDSYADLAVGTPFDSDAAVSAGTVHLIYGGPNGLDLTTNEIWGLDSAGIGLTPAANNDFGSSLTVGDFDGDLIDDLVIGIPGFEDDAGAALLLYGSSSGLTSDLHRLIQPGSEGFPGSSRPNELFAGSLSAGDINGDGADDLLVGVRNREVEGENSAGAVLIAFGNPDFGLLSFGSLFWNRSDLERVGNAVRTDRFGTAVLLDDFDNDGRADAVISSPDRDVAGISTAGDVVVVSTSESMFSDRFGVSAGQTFRDCDVCPLMVMVPSGSFQMGDLAGGGDGDELPVRTVDVAPFAAGVFELTWNEWDACVAEAACDGPGVEAAGGDEGWGRGLRPAINLSFNDAQDVVTWLSTKTGKSYRLLSEAEWEYAARAGADSLFHWGEQDPLACAADHPFGANYLSCRSASARTGPVGRYPANAFGLHEVHGSVWEWVEDCWNTSYNGAPTDGSPWLTGDCNVRLRRSGAWNDTDASRVRSANRGRNERTLRIANTGLRVARDP